MAPVWLEHVADQTVATPLAFVITEVEAPEGGHLPRIAVHRLEEAPHQHQKQYIEYHHE